MTPDDIAADLPDPRDDEPESLRQDIVDELADHLQCALHRELLASGIRQANGRREPADSPDADNREHSAWQQVLTRFGPPAQIARQLWWDAMKENIMAQRFTAIMAGITAAAAIAVAILLWRGIDQQARASAAVQQSHAAVMQRLVTLLEQQPRTAADPLAEDSTMRHLDLRLVLDEPDGSPAVGYELAPAGVSDDDWLVRLAGPRTDEAGRATLSMNRIGQFFLSIGTPDGWMTTTLIPMGPEHPKEVTLVVPSPAPPVKDLTIHIPRPEELSDQAYLFDVTLERRNRILGELEWTYAPRGLNDTSGRELRVLAAGDGQIIGRVLGLEDSREAETFRGMVEEHRVVFKTHPLTQLPAGEYAVLRVEGLEPRDDPGAGQQDRLGAVRGARYEFAPGTNVQTAHVDGGAWTIELPDFVWERELLGPPYGDLSSGPGGTAGDGFF